MCSSRLGISPCSHDQHCSSVRWSGTVCGGHHMKPISRRHMIKNMALILSLKYFYLHDNRKSMHDLGLNSNRGHTVGLEMPRCACGAL